MAIVSDDLKGIQDLAIDEESSTEAFYKIDRAVTAAIPRIKEMEALLKEWADAQEPAEKYDDRMARTRKALGDE